ncbi:MAG: MFS transporter [Bacillota bacterium]
MAPRTALILLFAATLLIRTGYGGIMPVLPLYAAEHGLSPMLIALMTNAYLASHAFLQGPMGHLSDRWGRRPMLLGGAALYALVAALFLLDGGPWPFTLLRALEGLAASAVVPVVRAAVVDLVAPEGRGRAFGALFAVETAGLVLGPLVGGWAHTAGGIQAPFLAGAGLSLLATLALLALPRGMRPVAPAEPAAESGPIRRGELQRILRSGAFWAAALPGISMAYLTGLYTVIWSLFMQEVGATPWEINLSWGLYSLPVVLLMVPFGALADRIGRPRMVLTGGLLTALITLAYGFFANPLPLLILCAVDGIATSIFTPASQAFIADVTPVSMRGRFLGLVGSASTVATIGAVTLLGALYGRVPASWIFGIGTLTLGAGTLLSVWLMTRRPTYALRQELED